MSTGYNYHMRVEAVGWTGTQRAMNEDTLDELLANMLEEMERCDVREVCRVTLYEGNRILLDWGPMHMAMFRAFYPLMRMEGPEQP